MEIEKKTYVMISIGIWDRNRSLPPFHQLKIDEKNIQNYDKRTYLKHTPV